MLPDTTEQHNNNFKKVVARVFATQLLTTITKGLAHYSQAFPFYYFVFLFNSYFFPIYSGHTHKLQ